MIEAKRYLRSVLDKDLSQDVLMVSDQAGAPILHGNEVSEVARRLREEGYPCDVLYLDVGWFGGAGACAEVTGEDHAGDHLLGRCHGSGRPGRLDPVSARAWGRADLRPAGGGIRSGCHPGMQGVIAKWLMAR